MKKTLALIIACLLLLPALAACGETGTGTETTSGVAMTTAPAESVPETEANALNVLGPRDFAKESVTFYSRFYNGVWITDLFYDAVNGDTLGDAVFSRNAKLESDYNVELKEIRSNAQAFTDTVETRVKSGDTSYDVLYMGLTDSAKTAAKGLLIDFHDMDNINLEGKWWSQSSNAAWSIGGRQFFATGDITTIDNMAIRCMYFNKQTIKNNQMTAPYEYVADNSWTFERFFTMVNAAGSDIGGDGIYNINDEYGVVAQTTFGFMMLMASGELITKKDGDDIPVLSIGTDGGRSIEVIDYLTGNISANNHVFLGDDTEIMAIFSTGRSLFMAEVLQHAKTMRQYDIDFGIIPMPKYNADQTDYYQYSTGYCCTVICFPVTTLGDRLDRASFMTEAMAVESLSTVTPAYYDVCLKTRFSKDVDSSEMIDIICNSVATDLAEIYAWAGMKSALESAISNGTSVTTLMNTYKTVMKRTIQTTVKSFADAKSIG